MFQLGQDKTEYYKIPGSEKLVSTSEFEGHKILKVSKEALTLMSNTAFRDVSFLLRRSHNEQVAKILSDPEASDNDKYVALTFLRNAEIACKGKLPLCQDTGTAIVHGEKGQQVWTGFCDEEALSLGVFKTYTEENLRYSQNAPLDMYNEVNTKCNLPAQIDIEACEGDEYKFLCVTKGGGSANKTYLYQETKARIQNPGTLVPFLVAKMKTLGTAACPPYHIAIVVGGTSAEKNLLTVKLASTHYYDELPTTEMRPEGRSATWSWRSSFWKRHIRLALVPSSEENISLMMSVSSGFRAMVPVARLVWESAALQTETSKPRSMPTVSGLRRWMISLMS